MSMFVCLSLCPHITKFLCVLSMAVARASSGVVAIRYILPVFVDDVMFAYSGQEQATRKGVHSN